MMGRTSRYLFGVLAALLVTAAVSSSPALACNHCKTTISFPNEPYAVQGYSGRPGWIKFTILTSDPSTVQFQDSNFYAFHYDFATNELPPFAGMTPSQFDAVTLHAAGQQAFLGAVVFPPHVAGQIAAPEYGIQLVRQDAYSAVQVRDLFNLVKSKIGTAGGVQAFYFPTYEQQESAEQNAAWLESQGIVISSAGRWASGNSCYAHGWALGTLKYFTGSSIESAYLSGALLPGDVLLTDGVPAEIPSLAGVISLEPSTPNSHVALLAATFGSPFVHLSVAAEAQRAQALVGHQVVLRADEQPDGCLVRLIDLEGVLDQATIDELLELKEPQPLNIAPVAAYGAYSAPVSSLQLSDIRYFGGKASHSGLLRRAIPASSPLSVAFSFDLWNGFLDQTLANGRTLRQEIALRLAPYAWPPNMNALSSALIGIQDLFKDTSQTAFSPTLQAAVLGTLQDPQYGFDPERNLRFRSSTNVEDTEQFTGAGLYDSFSGCLADELDGNSQGPSLCDPSESNERGVFRAIRRVFASFYYLNAYVERLRHAVNENQVGMALLVHHSFPDAEELANGVATLAQGGTPNSRSAYQVLQVGANSVTNPTPGQIPEEVEISYFGGSIYATLVRSSNLVQLGDTVLAFPDEYETLADLQSLVATRYATESGKSTFALDYEFKKTAPSGSLVITQVRPIPPQDNVPSVTPFLVNEPTDYCLYQGEYGTVFGNHRLKSHWNVQTQSLWLTSANLTAGFMADTDLEYAEVCQLYGQSGPLPGWPQATHAYASGTATEGWSFSNLQNPRQHLLSVSYIPELVAPSKSPVLVLSDFGCLYLQANYDRAVPSIDWNGPVMTTTDDIVLCGCPQPRTGDQLQTRFLTSPAGVTIETRFYWPPLVESFAGYTAPLSRFVETTIWGLTSAPIALQGDYAQTYRPEHHNFTEHFLFEPVLEPGLPQQQRDELEAQGIRAIHVFDDFGEAQFTYYDDASWGDPCLACTGFDGDRDSYCTGGPLSDCDDGRADVWATPGTVRDMRFASHTLLNWNTPQSPGSLALRYDTLRSPQAGNFVSAASCVESDDGADREATDANNPPPGAVFFYLTRAENDCPAGQGSLGQASNGTERQGRTCP